MLSRCLGYWETICKYAHEKFYGTGNVAAAIEIPARLDFKICQESFKYLFGRHPVLRSRLYEENMDAYFKFDATFPAIKILSKQNHWQDEIEIQLAALFAVEQALWRAVHLGHHDKTWIVIAAHHAILDGRSMYYLLQEFLQVYSCLATDQKISKDPVSEFWSIEEHLQSSQTWPEFIAHKENLDKSQVKIWDFHEYQPIANRKPKIIFKTFPENLFLRVKAGCKKKNTTLNEFLNAALLIAVQKTLAEPVNTLLCTPVDLRAYAKTPVPAEALGCYISMVNTVHHNIAQSNIWDLAKSYGLQLKEQIEKTGKAPHPFDTREFDMIQLKSLFDLAGNSRRKTFIGGFGLSNLGAVQFDADPKLQPEKMFFCTSRIIGDFVLYGHCLTLQKKMCFAFAYTQPLAEKNWILQILNHFADELEQADS